MMPPIPYKLIISGAIFVGIVGAFFFYGHIQRQRGIDETIDAFQKADEKGADYVRSTAEETIDRVGGVTGPDDVLDELRATGGLRED